MLFPHSDLMGDQSLGFKVSSIKESLQNNFDFNKLFGEGVNYTRLGDSVKLMKMINNNSDFA